MKHLGNFKEALGSPVRVLSRANLVFRRIIWQLCVKYTERTRVEAQRLLRMLLQGLLIIWIRVVPAAGVLRKFWTGFESRTNKICWSGL